jgi:hypothetical protein
VTAPSGNEVQVVTVTGAPDGGTFTLTYGGQTTAGLAFDATSAAVQTALRGLSSIGSSNVAVTGSAGGPYTVTFQGSLRNTNVAQLTASGAGLTGGTTPAVGVTTSTQGDLPVTTRCYVDVSAGGTVANLEVLVGQTPPAGTLPVGAVDYYGGS